MEFNRTYMGIHDMWKDLGWRIEKEFDTDAENTNVLIWYAWRVFGERLQKVVIIGNKIKNNFTDDNNKTAEKSSEATKENVETVETEIANIPEINDSNSDIDTVVEVDHEEKTESEFTLDVNTAIYAGTQIKDMYEGTGISFIDYHYLYLIGDTAREMERQLDKIEYIEMPDHSDDSNMSEIEPTLSNPTDNSIVSDVSETNDSDKTIINGIEVNKKEEQSFLEGEF